MFHRWKAHSEAATFIGLLRDAMMWRDLDRYLRDSWLPAHWSGLDRRTFSFLAERYPIERLHETLDRAGMSVDPDYIGYLEYGEDLGDEPER